MKPEDINIINAEKQLGYSMFELNLKMIYSGVCGEYISDSGKKEDNKTPESMIEDLKNTNSKEGTQLITGEDYEYLIHFCETIKLWKKEKESMSNSLIDANFKKERKKSQDEIMKAVEILQKVLYITHPEAEEFAKQSKSAK